jgi:hypothetical protein
MSGQYLLFISFYSPIFHEINSYSVEFVVHLVIFFALLKHVHVGLAHGKVIGVGLKAIKKVLIE